MTKLKLSILLALLFSSSLYCKDRHQHGQGYLTIVKKEKSLIVKLDGSAISFVGFEGKAKTKIQIQKLRGLKHIWNVEKEKSFTFHPSVRCKVAGSSLEVGKLHKDHRDMHLSKEIKCSKPIKGTNFTINLIALFPKLKSMVTTIVPIDGAKTRILIQSKNFKIKL